jgi:hypothetical protein
MSDQRPAIAPLVLAAIIEAAPGRVRNRLDKQPAAAESWDWRRTAAGWEIQVGEEHVRIEAEQGLIRTVDQVRCSCLLSPRCFHVLACVSVLKTAGNDNASGAESAPTTEPTANPAAAEMPAAESPPPSAERQRAAIGVREALAGILRVGARASGALLQSALLRAGHKCRAVDLPMLGNAALRIAEEVRRVRAQSDLTDSGALRQDLFLALHACQRLSEDRAPPAWALGTSRREFYPLAVSRLSGWFAEPILTRSGYAGVCVHLLAPDGRSFQVVETRPGDVQLVWQAYSGGIDLGAVAVKGSDLCRHEWAVRDAAASLDSRLGKGQAARWAAQGESSWAAGAVGQRFARPLVEQLREVFQTANAPLDARPAGWDLVTLRARILGAAGPALIASVDGSTRPWRCRIAIDDPGLAFRENLQLLARCPGLQLTGIARVRLESAGEVNLLAIAAPTDTRAGEPADALTHQPSAGDAAPRLHLPDEWRGTCNLGLDRLQRHHIEFVSRWGVEVTLDDRSAPAVADDGLSELHRRLTAIALGGHCALPAIDSRAHRRDTAALRQRNQATAADLVEALAAARSAWLLQDATSGTRRVHQANSFETAYLAAAVYLEAARLEFQRQGWEYETVPP